MKYVKENLAGAGTSADGGMSAPFSAIGQEIDSRRKQKPIPLGKTMGSYIDEDGEGGAPANNVGGGNVAGLGVGAQGEPGRPKELMPMQRRKTPRGRFMNQETFIIPHSTFVGLREAKRRGKHYRTYLDEDDSYHDIREYARKCKGPIIVEDERTGAMMYIRYGKGDGLHEAWTNQVDRGGYKWLSSAGQHIDAVSMFHRGVKKIGNYDKEHSVYTSKDEGDEGDHTHYHLVHNATGRITHSVNGPMKKGVLKVSGAGAMPDNKLNRVKMHDFYHHLLRKGSSNEAAGVSKKENTHPVALVGTSHSEGAQSVWRNLAKKARTTVHGWSGKKPVNLGKADDPEETHAKPTRYVSDWSNKMAGDTPEETHAGNMSLVASVAPPSKKKKIKLVRKRR